MIVCYATIKEAQVNAVYHCSHFLAILPVHDRLKERVQAALNKTEQQVLQACTQGEQSSAELLTKLGYNTRNRNFRDALSHLLELDAIKYTIPETPKHPDQKYRITEVGKQYVE